MPKKTDSLATSSFLGIPLRSAWWKHGSLNLLEHGVTRLADVAVSFTLIRVLSPDRFSKLALAQAVVAPALIFFISPSSVFLRDFARWKKSGLELTHNLRAFRHFGWLQGLGALGVAAAIAGLRSSSLGGFLDRFYPLAWAFGLALAQVVSAADRDLLRMELKLGTLNRINAIQRFGSLAVSLVVILFFGARFDLLALAVWGVVIFTAGLSRFASEPHLPALRLDRFQLGDEAKRVLRALGSFSILVHGVGVVFGTLQTSALLFAGLYSLEATQAGLLGAASKVANFAYAVPLALSQAYALWMARRAKPARGSFDEKVEWRRLASAMAGILGLGFFQAAAVVVAAPWLVSLLSGGRWSQAESVVAVESLRILILSTLPLICLSVSAGWFTTRSGVLRSAVRVYAPWASLSFLLAWGAPSFLGRPLASAQDFAWLQVGQAVVLFAVLVVEWGALLLERRSFKT